MAAKMELYCRPLEAWPGDAKTVRKVKPFKTGWESTLRAIAEAGWENRG